MKLREYADYDALGLKVLLDAGEISARELYEIALCGIETLNPQLNFLTFLSQEAAAHALSNLDAKAPFAGIPFLMKDSAGVAGFPMSVGSRLFEGLTSDKDSEMVRRLKRTGIVTLGASNIPEFANATTTESRLYGAARNPWNPSYSVGGSSGGAASAVAAGVVPMAQGSDGAGSIRVPAHCCGVFGLMPSRGRNPSGPDSYGANFGILRQHVITRTVRDSAAMLDHLHGPEPGALFRIDAPVRPFLDELDRTPGRLKVAFSTASPSGRPVHADCVAAVERAARLCEDFGHHVEEAAPAYDWEAFIRAFGDNWCFTYIVAEIMARKLGRDIEPDSLERSTLLTLEHARSLKSEEIFTAFSQLHAIGRDVDTFFADWDVFPSPVCLTPAPRLGVLDSNAQELASFASWFDTIVSEFAAFTPVFNIGGQPAVSVPFSQSVEGLPIGVQCVARVGGEGPLLQLAAQFERACPWTNRKPSFAHVKALV